MEKLIKNIEHATVLVMAAQVQYLDGQIVSKTLVQSANHSLTLFAFGKGEEISSHDSQGDAMLLVLDGMGRVTIGEVEYVLSNGDVIIMPAQIPHAVFALERFKMLLTVIFPQK